MHDFAVTHQAVGDGVRLHRQVFRAKAGCQKQHCQSSAQPGPNKKRHGELRLSQVGKAILWLWTSKLAVSIHPTRLGCQACAPVRIALASASCTCKSASTFVVRTSATAGAIA